MQPISKERAEWIEARLYVLSRMAGELVARGNSFAARLNHVSDPYTSIHHALHQINVERISLIAERKVIEDYFKENGSSN